MKAFQSVWPQRSDGASDAELHRRPCHVTKADREITTMCTVAFVARIMNLLSKQAGNDRRRPDGGHE